MVPNLDYKKDPFLESSLISNFPSNIPNTTIPQLCLLLAALTNKHVVSPIQALLHLPHPMVWSHGQTASFVGAFKTFRSTGHLEERCYPGLTNNRPTL